MKHEVETRAFAIPIGTRIRVKRTGKECDVVAHYVFGMYEIECTDAAPVARVEERLRKYGVFDENGTKHWYCEGEVEPV